MKSSKIRTGEWLSVEKFFLFKEFTLSPNEIFGKKNSGLWDG